MEGLQGLKHRQLPSPSTALKNAAGLRSGALSAPLGRTAAVLQHPPAAPGRASASRRRPPLRGRCGG
ncbi:MAG: hypothetical protein ACK56I_07170, partial [bacterium]